MDAPIADLNGTTVMRVQAALMELGHDLGPDGADSRLGGATGQAVIAYKTDRGLVPADPVVGPGTAQALDDDLLVDPPQLDPAFAEFAGFVVALRLEPFAA